MRREAWAGLLSIALAACSTGAGKTDGKPGEIVVKSGEAAQKALGQQVRVECVAQNAKLSAVLVCDGTPIYCMDKPSWPDEQAGKPASVTGLLEQTSETQAQTSPSGEVSQGTGGPILVLRGCK